MEKKLLGLFDEQFNLERITELGDSLKGSISVLMGTSSGQYWTRWEKEAKGPGSCLPFDWVMMFKILILPEYFSLSNKQVKG